MTGRIVFEPTGEHCCVVTFHPGDNGCGRVPIDHPAYWAKPATVLECDCGRTFVALRPQGGEMFPRWRREGRFARWRRERRQRRQHTAAGGMPLTISADPSVLPPSAAIRPSSWPDLPEYLLTSPPHPQDLAVIPPGYEWRHGDRLWLLGREVRDWDDEIRWEPSFQLTNELLRGDIDAAAEMIQRAVFHLPAVDPGLRPATGGAE